MRLLIKSLTAISVALSFTLSFAQDNSGGEVDFGFYQITGHPVSGKFWEYRDWRENLLTHKLGYRLGTKFGLLEAGLWNVAQKDQAGMIGLGKAGRYRIEADWNQTPHFLSNHSRLFLNEASPGVFTISDSIQAQLEAVSANPADVRAFMESYLSQARAYPLDFRRDKAQGVVRVSPDQHLDFNLSYSHEDKKGYKPTGTTTGTPGSFNVIEIPEPIDYQTHTVDAQAQYSDKDWSLQADYQLSVFESGFESIIWDNTTRLTDTDAGTIHASRGRIGTAPDNTAHNVNFSGYANLPASIQTRGSFGMGWSRQNQDFLPHTINSALIDTTGELVMPASSLNGEICTYFGNYFVTARPNKTITLEAGFRYYEYDNQTEELVFPGYVADGDHTITDEGRASVPYEYKRRNLTARLGFRPDRTIAIGVKFGREDFDREHRNVQHSNENSYALAVDFFPGWWFSIRNSYTRSERNAGVYDADIVEETFPEGEATINPHLEELRRFDQADRDRDRFDSKASVALSDFADLGLEAVITLDNYPLSGYGLLARRTTALSAGLSIYPNQRATAFVDYTREFLHSNMMSRYRNVSGGVGTDNPLDDWGSKLEDLTDIVTAGFRLDLIPQDLSWQSNYTYSYTHGKVVNTFVAGGAANGNAPLWPDTQNELQMLYNSVRFRVSAQVSLYGEYRFEKYFIQDFMTDNLEPYMLGLNNQGVRSIFLAATQPDYEAHIFGLRLAYIF
jgi:MtrB/PioB family decaheme-associated outer membrane protein